MKVNDTYSTSEIQLQILAPCISLAWTKELDSLVSKSCNEFYILYPIFPQSIDMILHPQFFFLAPRVPNVPCGILTYLQN